MTTLLVEFVDQFKVRDRWVRLGDRLSDWRPLWERVSPVVYARLAEWFDSQGRGEWAPLSPRYARWKEAHFPGRPTLVLTGALRRSVLNSGAPNNIERFFGDRAEWGTRDPKANWHQKGTSRMPARRVIVVDPNLRRDIAGVFADYIREEVGID